MRDGIHLATDVYLPATSGRAPVLLTRSPYNKNGERRRGLYFAEHGYVFVAQDCRGTGASEGVLAPLVNEGADGYDAIEWCARQPWSNGAVGTLGASYLAMDQYAAALERPPHLVAMYAAVGSQNFYFDSGWRGGIPSLGWPLWILRAAATSPRAATHAEWKRQLDALMEKPEPWLAQDRRKRADVFQNFPEEMQMYRDFYDHPTFDAYWQQKGFDFADYYPTMKKVPVLFLSGWYDTYSAATVQNFVAKGSMLIMGPWPHGYGKAQCGEANFGPSAQLDELPLQLDWFDHWLRGSEFKVLDAKQPVRYFRMRGRTGGEWITASAWRPPVDGPVYYLGAGGRLGVTMPAEGEGQTTFRFDPAHPVASRGGRFQNSCVVDQSPQPGVISFTSMPLDRPLDVTGTVHAHLWVSANAPAADFITTLVDVDPEGYAMPIADGQLRVTKEGLSTIDLGPTSNLFAAGHRIRLDIAGSSFPRLEPNRTASTSNVWHQADRVSYLELTAPER